MENKVHRSKAASILLRQNDEKGDGSRVRFYIPR